MGENKVTYEQSNIIKAIKVQTPQAYIVYLRFPLKYSPHSWANG